MKRDIQTAVVTGPTGPIGMSLCRVLVANGIKVYAITRPGSKRSERLRSIPEIRCIACDMTRLESLKSMITEHVDVFFHLAWKKTAREGRNDMDTQLLNIQCTLEACRTAKNLGCSAFVGSGSQAEYGRVEGMITSDTPCFPENGYGMAKLCAGQMSRVECRNLGLEHIWTRVLSIYGPYDGMHTMIMSTIVDLLNGNKPLLTAGEQCWDYLYSDDVGIAFYLLAQYGHSGVVYPIGSGKSRALREYVEILRDIIDPDLPLGFGIIPYAENQVMHLKADISLLEQDTGFRPTVDFSTGIRETIDFVRRQKNGL